MRLSDLLVSGERIENGRSDVEITALTSDSRQVCSGALFAALPGAQFNGAKFIPAAIASGAAAILVSESAKVAKAADIAVIRSDDARRSLALMAARFFAPQPAHMVAVTGTNGKTSIAAFVSQIWAVLGGPAASIGTLGVSCEGPDGATPVPESLPPVNLTSPDPITLHKTLQGLARAGYAHVAVEASSHGLEQRRVDGVELKGGAFTNITRDHLDYHPDFDAYLAAKLRLFATLLPKGALAVVNRDGAGHDLAINAAKAQGLRLLTHGRKCGDLRLKRVTPWSAGLNLKVGYGARDYNFNLDLVGGFQAENALTAVCLATAAGCTVEDALSVVPRIRGACGRLEPVGRTAHGGAVYIDYAHTPDALKTALLALRPHVSGRIVTVFGAGGDRDAGKRPMMGAAAASGDTVIVTDDNPRFEDPAAIRAEVLAGCSDATEIGDRAEAIAAGLAMLGEGDALLVAGKGHETGQEIGGVVSPFSDHGVIAAVLEARS